MSGMYSATANIISPKNTYGTRRLLTFFMINARVVYLCEMKSPAMKKNDGSRRLYVTVLSHSVCSVKPRWCTSMRSTTIPFIKSMKAMRSFAFVLSAWPMIVRLISLVGLETAGIAEIYQVSVGGEMWKISF